MSLPSDGPTENWDDGSYPDPPSSPPDSSSADAIEPADETAVDGVETLPTPLSPTPPPEDFDEIDTRLDDLSAIGAGYTPNDSGIRAEDSSEKTFEEVYYNFRYVGTTIAPGHAQDWADINAAIGSARLAFQVELAKLEKDDIWKGETHDSAIPGLKSSYEKPTSELMTIAYSASVMEILVEAFENTILTTKENIVPLWEDYYAIKQIPEVWDDFKGQYDNYARDVMQETYEPGINDIAKSNPLFTAGGPPELGSGEDEEDEGVGQDTPGGASDPGAFDGKAIPGFWGATMPDPTDTTPAIPMAPIATPSDTGLNGLTDPMRAASDAARNGLGPAADALKKAADGANQPFDPGLDGPPEGVLGLGPKGLGDSPRGGGAGGKTGAGAGPQLPRGLADGRPTGAATTSATRLPSVAGAVTGAGTGMMGPPGAGAPTGAQRGGDNNNGHQVLKALRRKKNGQDVVGDADAVVPVLGARERPAKPNADQSDQADHPATDVRPVPRGAHRPEQAATQVPSP